MRADHFSINRIKNHYQDNKLIQNYVVQTTYWIQ